VDLILSPFNVLRRRIAAMFIPAIPLIFLLAFLFMGRGAFTSEDLVNKTDQYLGMNLHLSAANLTAFDNMSTDIQMPLIRLGGIAEKTDIRELMGPDPANFLAIYMVLFLGFISYAMISRVVYAIKQDEGSMFGLEGINVATISLAAIAAFFMVFISSFSLGGFKLMLVISFGTYFTFSIPFAAAGEPVGESIFRGFKFLSSGMSKIMISYLGSMGAAVMVPVALQVFTAPLGANLEPGTVTNLMKLAIGLFSVVFALFFQMALCATVALENYEKKEAVEKKPKEEEVKK